MSTKAGLPSTALDAVTAGSPPILMLLVDLSAVVAALVFRRLQ